MKIEKVNIGLAIEQRLKGLGMSKSEFGEKIGIPQQDVNRILDKSSIDTDKLIEISKALDYNFFLEFIEDTNNAVANGNGSVAVNGNNNSHVIAGGETVLLQERIRHLEALLAEKERLIKVYEKMVEGKA